MANHGAVRLGAIACLLAGCAVAPAVTPEAPAARFYHPSPVPSYAEYTRGCTMDAPGGSGPRVLLQTATHLLRNERTGVTVTLVATIHMGSVDYFRALAEEVRSCDVILIEGLNADFAPEDWHPDLSWIHRYQHAISTYLNLVLSSTIKRRLPDYQATDIPLREISRLMYSGDGYWAGLQSEFKELVSTIEAWNREESEDAKVRAKRVRMLYEMLFDDSNATRENLSTKLDGERNRTIFRGLKAALKRDGVRRVALVYGVAHAWALEPRIVGELGFERISTHWHDALTYDLTTRSSR